MERFVLKGKNIYSGSRVIGSGFLLIEDGVIEVWQREIIGPIRLYQYFSRGVFSQLNVGRSSLTVNLNG